ncbi:uncharacterized protein VP01_2542g2 [Puccinia sorghi]|uniref:Uncharacterized protein n=1 Tax=Puccinia sorghi TaxID=27349 RepID=A0A0L6V739_9BASI|nr:uncharacterized protein VP01_2542g2 [Puccinia sorghi]
MAPGNLNHTVEVQGRTNQLDIGICAGLDGKLLDDYDEKSCVDSGKESVKKMNAPALLMANSKIQKKWFKSTCLICCPFSWQCTSRIKKGTWKISILNSSHEHPHSSNPAAHVINRKLSNKNLKEVQKPKTHPEKKLLATISTLYTEKKKSTPSNKTAISPIFHLHHTLQDSSMM